MACAGYFPFVPTNLLPTLLPRKPASMDCVIVSLDLWLPVGFSQWSSRRNPQSRRRGGRSTAVCLHPFRKTLPVRQASLPRTHSKPCAPRGASCSRSCWPQGVALCSAGFPNCPHLWKRSLYYTLINYPACPCHLFPVRTPMRHSRRVLLVKQ